MFERVYNRAGLSCSAKIYAKQRTDNELCLYAKWNRFQSKDMLCEDKNRRPYPWGYSGTRGAIPVSIVHGKIPGNTREYTETHNNTTEAETTSRLIFTEVSSCKTTNYLFNDYNQGMQSPFDPLHHRWTRRQHGSR